MGYNEGHPDEEETFRRNIYTPSSGFVNKPSKHASFCLFGLFLNPEHGGDIFPERQVDFVQTARNYIPEDSSLRGHSSEKLGPTQLPHASLGRTVT